MLSILWTNDDSRILSSDDGGAIYEWDISTGTRIFDCVEKENEYLSMTRTKMSALSTYVITKGGLLQEVLEGNIVHQVYCDIRSSRFLNIGRDRQHQCYHEMSNENAALSAICASNFNLLLFVGDNSGYIHELELPLEGDQTTGNQFQTKRLVK